MNIPMEFILISSSLGAVQSGFFSFYFLSTSKRTEINRRFLGLILFALSIRMAKSVGYYFSNDSLPQFIENIGYSAHIAIAPLLFLYVKSFVEKDFVFKRYYWFHFLPALLVVAFSLFLNDTFWLGNFGGYFFSLYYFGIYFPFIYYLLFKNLFSESRRLAKNEKAWLFLLVIGINIVWAAYSANFLFGMVSYITAPLAFSFVIYPISFFILIQHKMFFKGEIKDARYKNSKLTAKQIESYAIEIEKFVKNKQGFRDSHLTLPKLAKTIQIPKNTISEVINRRFKMSFTEYVNSYRLKEAQRMLKDKSNFDKKIVAIAFECGYGTLSAFNTTFKKQTAMTPTEYKKHHAGN